MPNLSSLDDQSFRRILSRNITLPLAAGVVSAGVFVVLLVYLISVMNWVEHSERVIGNANEVTKQMVDMETGLRGYMLAGDEVFLEPYVLSKPKVENGFRVLKELVVDSPVQVDRVRQIEAQELQWDRYAQEMIKLRAAGGDVLGPVKTGRGKTQFDEIRRLVDSFTGYELRLRQERSATAKSVTTTVAVIYLVLTLGVGGLLAYFGRRELMSLSRTYDAALRRQNEHNEQLQEQAWLRSGQNELAQQGIGQLALPLLASTLLQFLARYLDVAVGALYVREVDGRLRRAAAYGFNDDAARREQTLAPEQGLVGQSATENRLIRLDHVPADYIQVNSGLGQSAPASLVLVPIDNDGKVNGVVELGFMRPLAERDIDLLRLVAGNIGTAVEATLARQRLQEAFAETQQLNEELQVQQEELRTANEELEEQSRVLEESQVSLENQQAELEQTNEQLSMQALALDQKNEALGAVQVELEKRAGDLERASQYKSQFLANMSHELRTPLNSSLILAKLLSDNVPGNLTDEQVRYADTIYSAGNDLLNLINDILDISKVEAGKLELSPEDVSLRHVLDTLRMTFEPLAQNKKLEFAIELAPDLPATLHTDRQRLEQILKNLLSNAVKFTSAGRIAIHVSAAAGGQVAFAVRDSGIGIRAADHETIFGAFQQADGTTSRNYGGTGLGLSISRDLARLLGGSIGLASTPGEGSVFTLTLPLDWNPPQVETTTSALSEASPASVAAVAMPYPRDPLSPAAATAAAASLAAHTASPPPPAPRPFADDRDGVAARADGRVVLVVEDDPVFARILYDLAHEMQYRCLVAFDADEGLELAERHLPDAILLDVRLPDRSGLSVLQLLKDNAGTRHIPVHVVSGSDNMDTALHMGAIGFARSRPRASS